MKWESRLRPYPDRTPSPLMRLSPLPICILLYRRSAVSWQNIASSVPDPVPRREAGTVRRPDSNQHYPFFPILPPLSLSWPCCDTYPKHSFDQIRIPVLSPCFQSPALLVCGIVYQHNLENGSARGDPLRFLHYPTLSPQWSLSGVFERTLMLSYLANPFLSTAPPAFFAVAVVSLSRVSLSCLV